MDKRTFDKEKLVEHIIKEKERGISDKEIGKKYKVSLKFIEKVITETKGINISDFKEKNIKTLYPKDFKEEETTVWSFKNRGNWATHNGSYRGNWSPYIPRNIILKYSQVGDLVLDYFCGAGTTGIECKLLGRRCIALDINEKAIELARKNISFNISNLGLFSEFNGKIYEPELFIGDARDLSFLENNSVDLICSHPPYANVIHYTDGKEGDLSFLDVDDFLKEMSKVAKESFRVLKPGKKCAILIGDLRRKKHVVPLGFKLIDVFLREGFKLKELIIKRQHNCKTTGFWYERSIKENFLLLAHEYLPVFEKPFKEEIFIKETQEFPQIGVSILNRVRIRKRLNRYETTTVWLFPEDRIEEDLNKNVIKRFASDFKYEIINILGSEKDKVNFNKDTELLFIKSGCLFYNQSLNIENYLSIIKKNTLEFLISSTQGSFVVIQTKDIRKDGYIEPLAKKIVDILTDDRLWLKEIVIVVPDKIKHQNSSEQRDTLEITHQYLLIYEVKNGRNKS